MFITHCLSKDKENMIIFSLSDALPVAWHDKRYSFASYPEDNVFLSLFFSTGIFYSLCFHTKSISTMIKKNIQYDTAVYSFMEFFFDNYRYLHDTSSMGKDTGYDTDNIVCVDNFHSEEEYVRFVVEKFVRPRILKDGGDIQVVSFDCEDGVLTIRLQGACRGCPASSITVQYGIKNILKKKASCVKKIHVIS